MSPAPGHGGPSALTDDRLAALAVALGTAARRGDSGRLLLAVQGGVTRLSLELLGGRAVRFEEAPGRSRLLADAAARDAFLEAARASLRAGASFRFEPSPRANPPGQGAAGGTSCSAADLAIDLCAEFQDAAWLQARIAPGPEGGSMRIAPASAAPQAGPTASLTSQQGFLLSRADGTLSLQEILDSSPFSHQETLRGLFGLKVVGLITVVGGQEPPRKAPPPARPGLADLDRFLARTAPGRARAGGRPPQEETAPAWPEDLMRERRELEERCQAVDSQDHYAVLGLERSATEDQVRQAYYALARRFHPDRMHRPHLVDLQRNLERMFASITVAYSTLSDPEVRAGYDKELSSAPHGRPRERALDRTQVARDSFVRGRKLLDAGETYEALRLFELAAENDPRRAEYHHYLGVAQGQNPRWRKKAEESLLKAIAINPGSVETLIELSRLYHKGGLQRRAVQVAEQVLQWDPGNEEALRLAGRADDKGSGQAGILKGLFNKS